MRGKSFVMVRGCYSGPVEEGEALLAFWRGWQAPLIDSFHPMPFREADSISMDPLDPMPEMHSGGFLCDLSPETAAALIQHSLPQGGPPPVIFTEVRLAGGAVARVDPAFSAYSHRSERLMWVSLSLTPTPEVEQATAAHFDRMRAALGPSLTGKTYMNFLAGEEAVQRTREGYSEAALRKLQEVKAKYDPEGRLRFGYAL